LSLRDDSQERSGVGGTGAPEWRLGGPPSTRTLEGSEPAQSKAGVRIGRVEKYGAVAHGEASL